MTRFLLSAFLLCSVFSIAQTPVAKKKYPTLLWEITGKGMQQPSYLFGTMHVSDKMVFNLDDSFYNALKSVQTVALELDPGIWQEHYAKEPSGNSSQFDFNIFGGRSTQQGNLRKNLFSIDPYEDNISSALNLQPTNINGFLYRNSNRIDFEENTYLDLHIYQSGIKLGKKIAGLENIDSSDVIQERAQTAARKDKSRPQYDYESMPNINQALQDAYRKGDLDLLDSLQDISSQKAFRKVFLFDRNVIQANSIDTLLKKGGTVFAAVGAAHLPGDNGVIEELRRLGYKLRPVGMQKKGSPEKDRLDKMIAATTFAPVYTPDSLIKAKLPGQWVRMGNARMLQHADMANGTYYSLNRQRTSAAFWNEKPTDVIHKVDSLLYEKIAGKIQEKKAITVNGYPGLDVTALTRRGDAQRYRIIATPFELLVFKMSGHADYVQRSGDANRFFESIEITPLEKSKKLTSWQPAWGGFSAVFPHEPWVFYKTVNGSKLMPFEFSANDSTTGTSYNLIKELLPRSNYLEEDSFELNLMQESYESSKMVEKALSHKRVTVSGYPALLSNYKLNNGMYSQVLAIIQGPHYYSLVAQRKMPFKNTDAVLASFNIQPFIYTAATTQSNKYLGYSMQSNVRLPEDEMEKQIQKAIEGESEEDNADMDMALDILRSYKSIAIRNDTTGESITLDISKLSEYSYLKDSTDLSINNWPKEKKGTFILHQQKETTQNGWLIKERWYRAKNSSRTQHVKLYYKDGRSFTLRQYTDTLSKPSDFSQNVFSSFTPADTIAGIQPFTKKGQLFVQRYTGKDTTLRKRALRQVDQISFTTAELPVLKQITDTLNWNTKDYLTIKSSLISAVGSIEDTMATAWLKTTYNKVQDTAVFQKAILDALLAQKTLQSFKAFEELLIGNPPIKGENNYSNSRSQLRSFARLFADQNKEYDFNAYGGSKQWEELYDTLALTKQIMPGIMNLLVLDDYKNDIEDLLEELADSSLLNKELIQPYYTKYLLEAKQEVKKLQAAESAAAIERKTKEMRNDADTDTYTGYDYAGNNRRKNGNSLLQKIQLLLPFYEQQQPVRDMVQQLFKLENKELKMQLAGMLLKQHATDIPDTLFNSLAKDIETRQPLYRMLLKDSALNKFPKAYATTSLIAESQFKLMQSKKLDSFVLVTKRSMELNGKKGDVFVYKYLTNKNKAVWRWAVTGMIPADTLYTEKNDYDLDITNAGMVDITKNEQEEANRLIKEARNAMRTCAKNFYTENRNNNYYGSQLIEF